MTKVLVTDNEVLIREGLKSMLRHLTHQAEFIDATSLAEALSVSEHAGNSPALIIADPHLPDMNGMAGIGQLRQKFPQIPLLVFSDGLETQDIVAAEALGASACVDKTAELKSLETALRDLLNGHAVPKGRGATSDNADHTLVRLTRRERDVLTQLAEGCGNREIARRLNMQEATVKAHMRQIFRKLNVTNRTQAAALAWKVRGLN